MGLLPLPFLLDIREKGTEVFVSMKVSHKTIRRGRGDLMKLPLKFVITVLCVASVWPVSGQSLQTIYSFTNSVSPNGLTQGNDGNFYGTTEYGGDLNSHDDDQESGTIFKLTTNGTLTTLFLFSGINGAVPEAPLTLGNDGNFYGTTEYRRY